MNFPSSYHWLFKALVLALIVPLPVGSLVYSANHVSGAPESALVLVIFIVPPLWLMALVLLGRAAMDGGLAEEAKGELEVLLHKKQVGVLQTRKHPDWHQSRYAVSAPAPTATPASEQSDPVLGTLLAWKRRHCPNPQTEDRPA